MRAMVMAAGVGTRLRPLTCAIPKPMVPMANYPVLEHVFNLLRRHQINEIVVNLHFQPQMVKEYFGDGSAFGIKIFYSPEETLMGTAGGVKKVERYFNETFMVMSGDGISNVDLTAAVRFHKERKALATIVLKPVDYPLEYGVVITDKTGRITRFLEKPAWGEVFSNAANTGIYIFEPEIFEEMPYGESYDFGHQLFPKLLEKKAPIYGYVTDDYWCDIGDLHEYRQTHYHVLEGKVGVSIKSQEVEKGVWVGEGTQVHPKATLEAPVLIGSNCVIEQDVHIGAGTTIGNNCFIGEGSSLKKTIIWDNSYISKYNELRACVLGKNVTTESNVTIFEGAIISNDCVLGEKCIIKPNVKIWPNKIVEMGTSLATSLIWGERWRKNLFGAYGVSGRTNVEITPEFATKLSSAYGSSLPKGSNVIVAACDDHVCQVFKRVVETGLIAVGVNVLDAEKFPAATVRFGVKNLGVSGGIFIKSTPGTNESLTMEFYDSQGLDVNRNNQKKIETIFFREDFRRVYGSEMGSISTLADLGQTYQANFLNLLDLEVIARRGLKVVISCLGGMIPSLVRNIFEQLKCEVILLNGNSSEAIEAVAKQHEVSKVVKDTNADFGVIIDLNDESILFFDELGNLLANERMLLSLCFLQMKYTENGSIVVPVTISKIIEQMSKQFYRSVIWSKTSRESLMRTAAIKGVVLAGDDSGHLIFPNLHPAFDIAFALAKAIELVSREKKSFSELMAMLPAHYIAKETVECPWEMKGEVMRHLIEQTNDAMLDLIDGVKINKDQQNWVLVLPDSELPSLHIYAESTSLNKAKQQVARMKSQLFDKPAKKTEK